MKIQILSLSMLLVLLESCGTEVGNGLIVDGDPSNSSTGQADTDGAGGGSSAPEVAEEDAADDGLDPVVQLVNLLINTCASPGVAGALGVFQSDNLGQIVVGLEDELIKYNYDGQEYLQSPNESTIELPYDALAVNYEAIDFSCSELVETPSDVVSHQLKYQDQIYNVTWQYNESNSINAITLGDFEFRLISEGTE